MDFSFLDSGLIPSLNESKNGNIAHHALMGRSIPPTHPRPVINTSSLPPKIAKSSRSGPDKEEDDELTARPKDHNISPIARVPDGGLKGLMKMKTSKVSRRRSSMDGRISNPPKVPPKAFTKPLRVGPSANSAPEFQLGQLLPLPQISKERKGQHLSPPPQSARHARSSSWSAPLSARQSFITLDSSSEDPVRLLTALHLLIPPLRLDPLAPSPSTSTLHPPTLLSGLAFILEALVSERQILSSPTSQIPALPLLKDKSSLQSKSLELDWDKMHLYLTAFGGVMEGLLRILMDIEISETVLGLIEMIKTYIEKTRKVFGEVAGLYMDNYTFMGGWWVEEGMRGSAREVGRWSEMLART